MPQVGQLVPAIATFLVKPKLSTADVNPVIALFTVSFLRCTRARQHSSTVYTVATRQAHTAARANRASRANNVPAIDNNAIGQAQQQLAISIDNCCIY